MAVKTDVSTPAPTGGNELWRGLEELANEPSFQDMLHREFPEDATAWADPVTRRTFLTLAGASAGLAGIGCSPRPASREKIYAYVNKPEQITPGLPLFFATGVAINGSTVGVLAKSREGRPIKLEGNPDHPSSLGSIDPLHQAEILNLYDPDRSKAILKRGHPTSFQSAITELKLTLEKLKAGGKTIRVLTGTIGSPTTKAVLDEFLKNYPTAKLIQYDAVGRDNVNEGAKIAFGEVLSTVYRFDRALRVFSLDADFLCSGPGAIRYARDFNRNRNSHLRGDKVPTAEQMNRLYVAESMLTPTGSVADHRMAVRSVDVELVARALAKEVGVSVGEVSIPESIQKWVAPAAKDLLAHKGASVVLAGDHQSPVVHAICHAINAKLEAFGKTVHTVQPVEELPSEQSKDFAALVAEMNDKKVDCLFILGLNPAFTAPADVDFKKALAKVGLKIHMGSHVDETAALTDWHFNETHSLETWGDGRGHDGTATVFQPLIAPLYEAHSVLEMLAGLVPGHEGQSPRELVKSYWQKNWPAGDSASFDDRWELALRNGIIPGTARKEVNKEPAGAIPAYKAPAAGLEVNFRPDPTVFDGRNANNGWLQELPKPITKLTWDNAAIVSPKTAAEKGFTFDIHSTGGGEHGRAVVGVGEVVVGGKSIRAAVWIQPGHADNSITLHFGYGRERAGKVGNGTGFNVYPIRTTSGLWNVVGVELKGTGDEYILACTQSHHSMEGRRAVRSATRDEFEQNHDLYKKGEAAPFAKVPPVAAPHWKEIDQNVPGSPHEFKGKKDDHDHDHAHDKKDEHAHDHPHDKRLVPLTLYPPTNKEGRRWAMAIDLTACHGCSACMLACMAENNTAVVGKKEVTRGREMHWIRVDRYYEGDPSSPDNISVHFQPVPCQQCEKAPCEVVCPVAATVHSSDGLNDMVYNRCVGTRYCSNNCPYKVRRFNFLTYGDWKAETYKLMRNPEVSVRERGVMEKCTYCVQRIRSAEIEAERQGRPIQDGEIVTACQQACPAGAIIFGDLNDPKAKVNTWKVQPLNYGLLAELNTMPRTTYLAAIRNPNPEMPKRA